MGFRKYPTALALACLLSGPVLAATPADAGSYTEDTVRTLSDGRVFKRHVEQTETDAGFYRKEVLTSPEGKTATQVLERRRDAATGEWRLSESGVGFDGQRWSREQVGQPRPLVFGELAPPPATTDIADKPADKPAAKPTGPKRREFR